MDPLDVCSSLLYTVNCVLKYPACKATTGKILPICQTFCGAVDNFVDICTESQFFRNNSDFPIVNHLLDTFVCLDPQSYYNFPAQYIETDPNDCIGFCKYISYISG